MTPVVPIGTQGVTPEVLIDSMHEECAEIESLYAIAFTKTGEVHTYISGTASGMALAAAMLTETALRAVEG